MSFDTEAQRPREVETVMRRWQLFEFGDQTWLPSGLRSLLAEVLYEQMAEVQMYRPVAEKLAFLMQVSEQSQVVDCGSGLGGPWGYLPAALNGAGWDDVQITLTDRFPPVPWEKGMGNGRVVYHPQPLAVSKIPATWAGVRTFFTSFHHFDPETAVEILQTIGRQRHALGVFEFTQRRMMYVRGMLRAPLTVRPVVQGIVTSRSQRLWAALLPFVYWWDGTISHLRTYTPEELLVMGEAAGVSDYCWESGQLPAAAPGYKITYLIGYPTVR